MCAPAGLDAVKRQQPALEACLFRRMWAPAKHFEQLPLHSLYKEALPGGLSKNCDGAHVTLIDY